MSSKLTVRRCKQCNERFQQIQTLQYLCMPPKDCSWKYQEKLKANKLKLENKEERAELKVLKDSLLTHKDYLKMFQIVFNTFIRLRDADKPCVSCDCDMKGRKGDASHFYATGSNPALRFNEDNVHLSCVPCNQFKHGNLIEYGLRLPFRIGCHRFKHLAEIRNEPLKLSIPQIKDLIIHYKSKIKELKC